MRILVFIPMYNCEKQIVRVLDKIKKLGSKQRLFNEILILDNGSKDNSILTATEKAKELDIKVNVCKNVENVSLGGSHKIAFNYAQDNRFNYIIVLHGDDQGDINDIVPYIETGKIAQYDSYLGSRFEKESKLVNYSKFRIFGNHVFNWYITRAVKHKITDLGSGLNIYKVDYLRSKFYMAFPNSLTFNVYMLLYGVYSQSDFDFFALSWREEDQVSNAKFISQSKEILKLVTEYKRNAIKLFSVSDNEYTKMTYETKVVGTNE